MRKSICVLAVVLAAAVTFSATALAQEKGLYVCGVEGIKAASLPPPGVYWRMYNVFYSSDELDDDNGNKVPSIDLSVYALVNRLIFVSDKKFLGANYAADIIIPLVNTDIKLGPPLGPPTGLKDSKFGLGDICVEPFILSWHGARHDAAFGVGFFAPTGAYKAAEAASPGADHWTTMFTLGATDYLDQQKTWSLSALSRIEFHSEKSDTKVKPGSDLLIEWGLAKNLAKLWDIGLAGYYQWQFGDDSGSGLPSGYDKSAHDKMYALGPEISVFVPPGKLFLSLRSLWELGVSNRTKGNLTCLTMTKIF